MTPLRTLFRITVVALSLLPLPSARAAELIMFEQLGCEWCDAWNEDVGAIYDKTAESRLAPLRRVDIDSERPDDLKGINGIRFTPTFVVVEQGREIGRIIGYPGEDFFWQLLGEIIGKLKAAPVSEQ